MAECKHTSEQESEAENANKDEKQFTCSICIGLYRNPRYLPTCGHTFCEHCLLTYVSNIQQENQGCKFGCPVCRKPNNLPAHDEVTLQWIQTFPQNTVIIKMMESMPQSSEDMKDERRICDPCRKEGEANNGLKFCLDCKEVLCKTCTKYHKNFKMSEGHKLIDMAEMTAAASRTDFFTGVGKCQVHTERDVEIYCKSHDVVICVLCSSFQHNTCELTEIAGSDINVTKLRDNAEKLSRQMKSAIEHLNVLQRMKIEVKTNLKQNLKAIRENIEQMRNQVVDLMDKMVNHVADVTKQIEIDREDAIDADIARLLKLKNTTKENIALMEIIGQHGSEKHKFVSSHLIEKRFEETNKQLSEEDKNVKQLEAKLIIADNLKKLIECSDVKKLVQINMTENESSHTPFASVSTTLRDAGTVSNNLRDSKLVNAGEHTVCPDGRNIPYHRGVAMHRDGRVILNGFTTLTNDIVSIVDVRYLCLYNPASKTTLNLILKESTSSAVQIDDTHIAASHHNNKTISIVTVNNKLRVEKTLNTQYTLESIVALSNCQLAVAWSSPPAFGVIGIKGTEVVQKSYLDQDERGRKFRSFEYLAIDEMRHHVIQPCFKDVRVYCFDFKGKPVFKYTHPGLKRPRGVALDKCGNIYVCESANSSIHKLSPEGEPISVFTEGVPSGPWAICSDNTGAGFWVTRDSSPRRDIVVYFKLEQNKAP